MLAVVLLGLLTLTVAEVSCTIARQSDRQTDRQANRAPWGQYCYSTVKR